MSEAVRNEYRERAARLRIEAEETKDERKKNEMLEVASELEQVAESEAIPPPLPRDEDEAADDEEA